MHFEIYIKSKFYDLFFPHSFHSNVFKFKYNSSPSHQGSFSVNPIGTLEIDFSKNSLFKQDTAETRFFRNSQIPDRDIGLSICFLRQTYYRYSQAYPWCPRVYDIKHEKVLVPEYLTSQRTLDRSEKRCFVPKVPCLDIKCTHLSREKSKRRKMDPSATGTKFAPERHRASGDATCATPATRAPRFVARRVTPIPLPHTSRAYPQPNLYHFP